MYQTADGIFVHHMIVMAMVAIILTMVWIICTIGTISTAREQKRSWVLWGLFAALLGPFSCVPLTILLLKEGNEDKKPVHTIGQIS